MVKPVVIEGGYAKHSANLLAFLIVSTTLVGTLAQSLRLFTLYHSLWYEFHNNHNGCKEIGRAIQPPIAQIATSHSEGINVCSILLLTIIIILCMST